MGNFKQLRVWKRGVALATDSYRITRKTPFAKDYGLSNQIQRAAVSISSNIAEGDERGRKLLKCATLTPSTFNPLPSTN